MAGGLRAHTFCATLRSHLKRMGYPTIPECLLSSADRFRQSKAQLFRGSAGWEAITSEEMLRRIAGLSRALGEMGIAAGDRVAIFSANRPEWHIADFAILGIGAVDVPIYFRESNDRLIFILNHSGARVVFVAGEEQAEKIMACRGQLLTVEHVIVAATEKKYGSDALRYETLIASADESEVALYRKRVKELSPDLLATIIYTSGTTGDPKGVMLSHSNLSSNALDVPVGDGFESGDVALSFLPISHVFERIVDYLYLFRGVSVAYVEAMESLPQALLEVRPNEMAAVPRVFEKLYANIISRGHERGGFERAVFDWAMRVAARSVKWRGYDRPVAPWIRVEWSIANKLVFSKIRKGIGGRFKQFISGGAPLAKELSEFYWSIGIPVYQGYGLTEASPVVATNCEGANRIGTVGRAVPNVNIHIADDGEIMVQGPNVMQGYYRRPLETSAVLSPDRWLATGDIGQLDSAGYLTITDRKKDLLKTSGGKLVAPQPIENSLKMSPYIQAAAVVGDRRRFIAALIVPNFASVASLAASRRMQFASHVELAQSSWVRDLISREVDKVNQHLAQYETIKRFVVLDSDFSFDSGELTYTMKLKRRVIEQKYQELIARIYADVDESRPAQQNLSGTLPN